MYFGVVMLLIVVSVLSAASLQGVLKFRKLTKSMRERSLELPKAADLAHEVSVLRSKFFEFYEQHRDNSDTAPNHSFETFEPRPKVTRLDLITQIQEVRSKLVDYEVQLENIQTQDRRLNDNEAELDFVEKFGSRLDGIERNLDHFDVFYPDRCFSHEQEKQVAGLQMLVTNIPKHMNERMAKFSEHARTEYHAWMSASIMLGACAILLIAFLMLRFRARIIQPLETLIEGSRQVAAGNFDYRIKLETDDEVAELGDALNAMTANFQSIKSDLNHQVQQRTKEVVRSEKMASVGFLAAGIAHEINNPLASIAWSAESLESRIHDILNPRPGTEQSDIDAEIEDMKKYLRRIQDEAFRCKGITAGLLDFSRMGDVTKIATNLVEIIDSVIEIVKPLSKYRGRNIVFNADPSIIATVNEQEMKQVALNLITNALGSVAEDGTVEIELKKVDGQAQLVVRDDGCGMTDEVMKHLFEPFFTRRRDGQGTGLGLSITYQIIEEHGGRIFAHSDGPGKGSSFTVSLPLVNNEEKQYAKSAA